MDVFTPCTDTHAMEGSPATASRAGRSPVEPILSFCPSCQSVPPVHPSLLSVHPSCPPAHPPTAPRYLCSRATRRSLSSLPLNPLAKGLFSIFSCVIFKRRKSSRKHLKRDHLVFFLREKNRNSNGALPLGKGKGLPFARAALSPERYRAKWSKYLKIE